MSLFWKTTCHERPLIWKTSSHHICHARIKCVTQCDNLYWETACHERLLFAGNRDGLSRQVLHIVKPVCKGHSRNLWEHNLDFDKLLDASEYKKNYNAEMIKCGEEKRRADPGYFCRLAEEANKPIWIISDAKRKSDVDYFLKNYRKVTQTVRIVADENVRIERGYQFTKGIDDAESECGLDTGVDWDIVIYNNGDNKALENKLDLIVEDINMKLAENKL